MLVLGQHKLLIQIPGGNVVAAVVEHLIHGKAIVFAHLIQERLLNGKRQVELRIGKEVRARASERILNGVFVKRLYADRFIEGSKYFVAGHGHILAVIDVDKVLIILLESRDYAADGAEAAGVMGRLGNIADAGHKVVCSDLVFRHFAIVVYPVDIRAEVERPNAVIVIVLPAFRQTRDGGSVFIGFHKAINDIGDEDVIGSAAVQYGFMEVMDSEKVDL